MDEIVNEAFCTGHSRNASRRIFMGGHSPKSRFYFYYLWLLLFV